MRKIKMIWDFKGPEASKIASHHAIHLQQFINQEKINATANFEDLENIYSIAYMIIEEKDLIMVRDTLKPHRAELFVE